MANISNKDACQLFLRHPLGVLGIALMAGIAVFVVYSVSLYLSHNRAAEYLFDAVNKLQLPPKTTFGARGWNVGAYEGASTLCEAMAFIVIKSNEPREEILNFYSTRLPALSKELGGACYIASFDSLPQMTPSEITKLTERISPNQRSITYAVWIILPLEDQGWDIRGW